MKLNILLAAVFKAPLEKDLSAAAQADMQKDRASP